MSESREATATKAPITAHRWFPAVVGLWFAALFGLSSLAVAPATLEAIITLLRIDQVFEAATPPLGETARLLVALGMSSLGEIAGLLLGRYLAARNRPEAQRQRAFGAGERRSRDAHPDAPPRKPLSANEDLGRVDSALRRRALASEIEADPKLGFETVPLPGVDGDPLSVSAELAATAGAIDAPEKPALITDQSTATPSETLDLGSFTAAEPVGEAGPAPFAQTAPLAAEAVDVADPSSEEPANAPTPLPQLRPQSVRAVVPPLVPSHEVATASLESLGVVQLSERLAMAMQARRERIANRAAVGVVAPATPAVVETAPFLAPFEAREVDAGDDGIEPLPESAFAPAADETMPTACEAAGDDIAKAPQTVGQAEATEPRLPEPYASPYFSGAAQFAGETAFEDEDDGDLPMLARSLSAPNGPFSQPGAFSAPRSAAETQEGPDEAAAPAPAASGLARGLEILARRAPAAPDPVMSTDAANEAPQETGEPDDFGAEDSYSSLLSIGAPAQRGAPARIEIDEPEGEIEPVVIFPGHGPRTGNPAPAPFANPAGSPAPVAVVPPAAAVDAEEAERALKAALASLQRISGAR